MPKNKRYVTKHIWDFASEDETEVAFVMKMGACVTCTLMVLDDIKELKPGDPKIPAYLELLAYFASPVIDAHPETYQLVKDVLLTSINVLPFFEK